jgi:hypothetical protein
MSSSVYGHTLTKWKNPWGILENESPFFFRAFHFLKYLVLFFYLFFLMIPGGYPLGIMGKINNKKIRWKFVDFYVLWHTNFGTFLEIMCHQPRALGARYVMNTPTLGYYPTRNAHLWGRYVFQDGHRIFWNACLLLFALFLWYPKGISWKK